MSDAGDVRIGAYDAAAWAGLVLSRRPGEGFAFRFAPLPAAAVGGGSPGRPSGDDVYDLVREVGPHAPDGGYARLKLHPSRSSGEGEDAPLPILEEEPHGITLEWARVDGATVVGRVTAVHRGMLELRTYFPWDWRGRWERRGEPRRELLVGRSGESAASLRCVLQGDRGEAVSGAARTATGEAAAGPEAVLRYDVGDGAVLRFAACVAAAPDPAVERTAGTLSGGRVDAALERARLTYEDRRVAMTGSREGAAAAVSRCIRWTVLLQPETGRRYTPAGRRWIFPRCEDDGSDGLLPPLDEATPSGPLSPPDRDHWTIFGWDTWFNALELAVESPALARDAMEAGLATRYPNGNVPNWRGRFGGTPDRSQPPLASYAALRLHARTGDASLLATAFPALERWSAWWRAPRGGHPRRDGNGDGLFEWGADVDRVHPSPPPWERGASHHQKAAWESGQDDLPNWDEAGWVEEAGTLDLAAVDLNSYLALDLECLARIAALLGETGKSRRYRELRQGLAERMNERLWHADEGVYVDRKWSGEPSTRIAASNFLPLLAGVPDDARARRMVARLTDPEEFWEPWPVPSISRSDPAYPDQQYWRGAVWPPMNYLVCQGLRRYGFDGAAGELARRSADLFLASWRTRGLCRENYDARTGEGGGRWHQSWGALLPLLAVEEYADATPWEGLRVGSLGPDGAGALLRLPVRGHSLTVSQGPDGLSVSADGRERIATDAPAVLRELEMGTRSVEGRLHTQRAVGLRVDLPGERFTLTVDGGRMELASPSFRLPGGRHAFRIEAMGRPAGSGSGGPHIRR